MSPFHKKLIVLSFIALSTIFFAGSRETVIAQDDLEIFAQDAPSPQPREGRWNRRMRNDQNMRTDVITMNFDKADIVAVLKLLGRAAGITMAIAPQVQGTITIASTTDVPLSEAFDIVNSILHVRGFTLIGTLKDRVVQVVPLKDAVTSGTGVGVGTDESSIASGDTLVTQIIPLKRTDATKLKTELAPMLSKDNAALMANAESNTLVVTDTRSNVKRILSVIRELDKDLTDVLTLEVIPLQHANAPSVAETLSNLFVDKTTGQRAGQPQPMGGQEGGPPKVAGDKGFVEMRGQVKISADPRTNSLILSAAKEKIDILKGLIAKLDTDINPDVKVKVFVLKNADATSLAEELNQIFEQPSGTPQVRPQARMPWDARSQGPSQPTGKPGLAGLKENYVIPDVRTNSVVVTAREENMTAFSQLVETLDRESAIGQVTRVYRLIYAKADDLAQTLTSLFQGSTQRGGGFFAFLSRMTSTQGGPLETLKQITVVSEPKSNSVVVTGPPQVFDTISKIILELDKQQSQVFIEVLIVDVTLDATTQLGMEWAWTSGKNAASTNLGTSTRTTGLKYSIVGSHIKGLLQALMEKQKVKVLSTPHITTMDNIQATINIGQNYPVITSFLPQPNGQSIPQFTMQPISVSLTVTPHITSEKFITMDINQTINDLQSTIQQGGFQLPIIALREAKTSVRVEDSQTIVIGGIMKDSKTTTERKVPFLGDIPFLGRLFRDDETKITTNELMVFITPHIVNSQEEANRVTQEQRGKLIEGKLPDEKVPTKQGP